MEFAREVTFEQAKVLRSLGFQKDVDFYYTPNGDLVGEISSDWETDYPAPTVSFALKFVRDLKKVGCSVHQVLLVGKPSAKYSFSYNTKYGTTFGEQEFEDYDDAESALLDAVLEVLKFVGTY